MLALEKHKILTGEERPSGCQISDIPVASWDGVLDERVEVATRTTAKKPKVKG